MPSNNDYMKEVITREVFRLLQINLPDGSKCFKNSSAKLYDTKTISYEGLLSNQFFVSDMVPLLSYMYELHGKTEGQKELNKFDTSEQVKKPSRYNQYEIETIEMMKRIFGLEEVIKFCEMTAFKYRMRLGHKDDVKLELAKEKEYLEMAERFKNER